MIHVDIVYVIIIVMTSIFVSVYVMKRLTPPCLQKSCRLPTNTVVHPQLPFDPVSEYDNRKLYDIFEDPTRRVSRQDIPPIGMQMMLNVPSRGFPDTFHKIGILTKDGNDDNRILRLFGRKRYEHTYDYYTAINVGHDQIKIMLDNKRRELYDGDTIHIQELNATYNVKLDDFDEMRYNPYLV